MKKIKINSLKTIAICGLLAVSSGCDRSISDDVEFATFSKEGEIFNGTFVGMGTDFYFPFIGDGAKAEVFSIDETEGFESEAAIRIDVPNADDPDGSFAGASFIIDGPGRNLTEFDALTFWAKSTQAATIGSISFGKEFRAAVRDVDITTQWQKYTIPIPDPSKLLKVKTVFEFSAGGILPGGAVPNQGQEVGYTFWIDGLRFEKLGTIAQPQPAIFSGTTQEIVGFSGGTVPIGGFTQTFNLATGQNVTVETTSGYFEFQSTDTNVARANESGVVSISSAGTATITATLDGGRAEGSLVVESLGSFISAPTPTVDPADVISLFSDAYTDVPVSLISNFGEFQNSTLNLIQTPEDNVLNYQNVNFFGIQFNSDVELATIDGSQMNTLHMDLFIPGGVNTGASLNITLRNVGPNGIIETDVNTGQPIGDDTEISTSPTLVANQWIPIDLDITGLTDRSALGQIVFVAPAEGPSNFYVDNIYLYR